jgi:UDP-glucose 4-epimerase
MSKEQLHNVLITGPTGSIGISLVEKCVSCGIKVLAVCHRGSKRIENIPKDKLVTIIECNLDELSKIPEMFPDQSFDAFFHLGWEGTFGKDRQNINMQLGNVRNSIEAVEVAHKLNCKVFVGVGSQSEFGHKSKDMKPDDSCFPDNGYGVAKLSACYFTRMLCQQYGIRHIWDRVFSAFGIFDNNDSLIISCINNMISNNKMDFTEGTQIWDFLYSEDVAKALLLSSEKGRANSIYCIGSGETRTLKQYIESIRNIVNPSFVLNFGAIPFYENQVMYLKADISSLEKDTGYKPQYTFEEAIRDMINKMNIYKEKSKND